MHIYLSAYRISAYLIVVSLMFQNHEVKTEVLEKFMSLIDLSTGDTLLQKRKTGTVKPEVESSELAIDLPAVAEGQPRTTSQLSICDDSDGLVIDLGKDPELVDRESVRAENGALTGVGKETGNDGMEGKSVFQVFDFMLFNRLPV